MGGATCRILHLLLWHVQKQTVHNVLRSDTVLYRMIFTGFLKSDYTDCTTCDFELCWELCFILLKDWTG
jgi:hypothetical protein